MPSVDSWCLFLDVNGDVGERFSCGRGFHPDPESREPFNHSTWFLSLEFCTSWIKSLKSLSLIFITQNLHIMNQNQVAYLLYRSSSNYFSSVEHFEPRILIAHVQFFPLQVPFSPKFEADFWPDERLEQASILVTLLFSGSVLMILLFRQTVGKETLNPLAAVLSPLLTFRYCRPYKDSHLIKSSSKFNFSNLQEIL